MRFSTDTKTTIENDHQKRPLNGTIKDTLRKPVEKPCQRLGYKYQYSQRGFREPLENPEKTPAKILKAFLVILHGFPNFFSGFSSAF